MIERFSRPSRRVERAFGLARLSHAGAVRKGTRIPYIEHPLSVALLLESHGYDEDMVVAGLLHDTVEDTRYDDVEVQAELNRLAGSGRLPCPAAPMAFRDAFLEFIAGEFGPRVLDLVLAVTERKNDGGVPLDWLERKREQLDKLACASPDEAALKAADAVHNIETTLADIRRLGLGVLDRFRGGSLTVWHYSAIAGLAAQRMPPGAPLAARVTESARLLCDAVQALRPRTTGHPRYPPPTVY